jgi:hypothetical protein
VRSAEAPRDLDCLGIVARLAFVNTADMAALIDAINAKKHGSPLHSCSEIENQGPIFCQADFARDARKIRWTRVIYVPFLFSLGLRGKSMAKRPHYPHPLDESELQFHVELWSSDGNRFDRCIAASSRVAMATAMVPLAAAEFPDKRIIV